MPRKNLRRAASKEALKQMQLLSATAYEEDDTETFEIASDDDVVSVDMPPKKKYRLSHRKSSDGNDRDVIVLKSINAGEEILKLDIWTEELSPVQQELRSKSEKELQELNTKLEQIAKHANADVLYQGESCTAYEIDTTPVVAPPATYTTTVKEPKKKTTTLPQSKSQQPNVVIQPSKSNNSYQLVVDPRLGLIVGTMTPAAAPTIPPPLAKPQSPVPPVVQTRQTRRRGRNSVQVAALPAQPPPPPTPPPPPPPPQKVQKAAPTPPATPVVQLRPTEATSVGGLSTGAATVQKNNTVTTSTVVDLTADDGRPAADSREISFNKLQGKTFPSLVVVARPHLGVKDISGGDRTKLDSKVKSVLMHVPTKFTEWLIQQGLIRSEQSCTNHANSKLKLGMYSDVSKFPYSGGYVWISECCPHRFVSVFSGSLFEGSPHPPSVILKLIYHWACQTNVQNVVQWVKVDNLYVKGMNTWLRAICTVALHSHIAPLGGPGRRVEVGVISLGTTSQDGQQRQVKVEVLGLLESDAKLIRLRAVEPLADGDRNYKKRFSKILEPLLQWVHPESIIVTDLTVDKSTLHTMGFAHVQQSTSSDHNLSNHTIMEYLRRIVPRMFQNTLSLLSRQIIQQFLDELVWREWYGTTAAQCFDNMLIHLSEQTRSDTGQSLIMRLNKVAANPFKNWSISTSNQPTTIISKPQLNESSLPTKRTSGRQRKIINVRAPSPPAPEIQQRPPRTISPDIPEQMVPLENYYYGTIEGQNNANAKIGWNIKCSMCKSHFSNNIRLMTHLFSHAHNVTGGIQQCRYCLSSVGSMEGLAKHIITSHPYETKFQDGYICVICETRFANSFSLGKHLSKEHVPAELPYQCGTCGFRCSSHRQAIDHFYKTHDSGSTIQCPFCLKSTTVCSSGRIMPQNLNFFMQHLQKHQKKAMAKKCPKCALWFIHKDTLKEHQINMHSTQRRKAGLISWSAPRNGLMVPKSKQDKQVWEDTEREINFANLTIDAPNKLACKECKVYINLPRHYQSLESCSNRNCQYLTCCKSAMDTHMKICKNLNESLPISTLPKEMFCVCGYSDDDGNTLAKHLAECERKSAYPSAEAAKKAIKTHSMLDVLGLVRRPEEPPTPQASVEVTELDKDEKKHSETKPKDTTKKLRRLNKVDKDKKIEKADDAAAESKKLDENVVEIKDDDDDDASKKTRRLKKVDKDKKIEKVDDAAAESKKLAENVVEIKDDDDDDASKKTRRLKKVDKDKKIEKVDDAAAESKKQDKNVVKIKDDNDDDATKKRKRLNKVDKDKKIEKVDDAAAESKKQDKNVVEIKDDNDDDSTKKRKRLNKVDKDKKIEKVDDAAAESKKQEKNVEIKDDNDGDATKKRKRLKKVEKDNKIEKVDAAAAESKKQDKNVVEIKDDNDDDATKKRKRLNKVEKDKKIEKVDAAAESKKLDENVVEIKDDNDDDATKKRKRLNKVEKDKKIEKVDAAAESKKLDENVVEIKDGDDDDSTKKMRRLKKMDKDKKIEKVHDADVESKKQDKNVVEIKDDDDDENEKKSCNIQEADEIPKKDAEKNSKIKVPSKGQTGKGDENLAMEVDNVESVKGSPAKVDDPTTINEDEVHQGEKSVVEQQTDEKVEDSAENTDDMSVLVENADVVTVSAETESPKEMSTTSDTINKAAVEAIDEVPVEKMDEARSETIDEVPVEKMDEAPSEKIDEVPSETVDEVPVETIDEAPAETIDEEAPAETIDEAPAETIDEEAPAETIDDEAPAETIDEEAPAETIDEAPAETIDEEAPAETIDEEAPAETIDEAPAETLDEEAPAETIDEAPAETIDEEAPAETIDEEAPAETIDEEAPAETTDEAPAETIDEAPAETIDEEAPAETIDEEAPAETIDEEAPAETTDEAPAETIDEAPTETIDEEAPAETIDEEAPAETIDEEAPAETTDEAPAETIDEEAPAETIDGAPAETIDEAPTEDIDETRADKNSTTVEHAEKSEAVNNMDSFCDENAMEVDTAIEQSESNTDLSEKTTEVMETDAAEQGAHELGGCDF